jgi:hypothetical protein
MSKWCGVLSGGGVLLMVAGGALFLASASLVSGQGPALMSVAPASQNLPVGGEQFIVDIKLDNVENLGAYDLTMSFDPEVLEFTAAADADFVASTGRHTTCVGAGPAATVNARGAFTMSCSSNGLIDGGDGTAGPSASDVTIARVAFKPKAVGVSDLRIRAWDPHGSEPVFQIGTNTKGEPVYGYSGLSEVEVCDGAGSCEDGGATGIEIEVQNGVVKVFDPNAPTPTGVPATPTRIAAAPTRDIQATVQAVLGTPTRRLTPVPGSSTGTGSGSTLGGSTRPGGSLPAGTTSGSNGAATGPDGAPLAGHGPGTTDVASWPQRAGLAMGFAGMLALTGGFALRRRSM